MRMPIMGHTNPRAKIAKPGAAMPPPRRNLRPKKVSTKRPSGGPARLFVVGKKARSAPIAVRFAEASVAAPYANLNAQNEAHALIEGFQLACA